MSLKDFPHNVAKILSLHIYLRELYYIGHRFACYSFISLELFDVIFPIPEFGPLNHKYTGSAQWAFRQI